MASMTKPLDSATVILTRDSSQGQYRILLMRRHRDQDFMGGAFVFPGGRLDEGDCDPDLVCCTSGLTAAEAKRCLQAPDVPEGRALGLFFAALRETFEEAGVLMAYDQTGQLIDFAEGETAGRFAAYRLQLLKNRLSLRELAERENLQFALDLLVPYSHWITPQVESKRFSTRFFLARKPAGQLPFHDTIEMTKSQWIAPSEAIELHRAGQILLMPPTLKTVEELNEFHSVDDLFTAAHSRRIRTILPETFATEDGFGVRLPHDPEYTTEAYKQSPRPLESSRIVMRDGTWRTERAGDPD
jgi:8-oxo-dGTP pyrophosphatase MutT (NUDIX family)